MFNHECTTEAFIEPLAGGETPEVARTAINTIKWPPTISVFDTSNWRREGRKKRNFAIYKLVMETDKLGGKNNFEICLIGWNQE